MKCPICDQEMKTQAYLGDNILEEESGECMDEHHFYSYSFAYGNTKEIFGPAEIYYTHHESNENREHRLFLQKILTYYEREWYRKKRGGN